MKLSFAHIGLGSIFSVLTFVLGGWDLLLKYLILFMVFDYVTGIIKATLRKEITPQKGFIGLAKKIAILIIVAIAHSLDRLFSSEDTNIFGMEFPVIRTLVIWGYMINEIASILRNIKLLGVPLPPILLKILAILQEDERVNIPIESQDKSTTK